jgi:hypothetical protein
LGGADLIHQFVYWEGDQQDSMIESKKGETNLNYWRDYYVPRYFPKGSALLSTTSSLSGIEVMAAKPPGSKNIHVMVINRQVANKGDVGGVGVPATVEVNLSHSAAVKEVTVRMLDNSTPTKSGPPAIILPVGTSAKVSFSGYGVALLEFVLQPSKSK